MKSKLGCSLLHALIIRWLRYRLHTFVVFDNRITWLVFFQRSRSETPPELFVGVVLIGQLLEIANQSVCIRSCVHSNSRLVLPNFPHFSDSYKTPILHTAILTTRAANYHSNQFLTPKNICQYPLILSFQSVQLSVPVLSSLSSICVD